MKKNLWENIEYIKEKDEIKFVIANKEDYNWAKQKINEYDLIKKCTVLMISVPEGPTPRNSSGQKMGKLLTHLLA